MYKSFFSRSIFSSWIFWAIAMGFFAFQFILRLLPGLIMPQIMEKFQVGASQYGLLSSMYYFGYAGAQLPIAFYLDRFGPRRIISICILLCSIGTLVLSHSTQWSVLLVGRFLVGVGSAAGFLGTAKVVSQWFRPEHYARMVGITFTFGLLGAVYGGRPVASWILLSGWEQVMNTVALIGFGLGAVAAVFLRKSGPYSTPQSSPHSFADLRVLLTNKTLVLLGVCNLLMVGSLEGFADVWGIPYLMKAYALEKEKAAFLTSLIFFGMLLGGPILAFLAEKTHRFFEITALCGALMAGLMVCLLFVLKSYHFPSLTILFTLVGILCCYQVLILSMASQLAPSSMLGIATAFLNCVNMLGGAFFHSSIGFLLNLNWTNAFENGTRIYSADHFKMALLIIPVASFLGGLGVLMLRSSRSPVST